MRMSTTPAKSQSSGDMAAGVQATKTDSSNQHRQKQLNMQRIQLAEKLSDERKRTTALESDVTDLQDQLASLTLRNEAAEKECTRMRKEIEGAAAKEQGHAETLRRLETAVREGEKEIMELCAELQKASIEVSEAEKSHESREDDLQQLFTANEEKTEALKFEIETLRGLLAEAASEKESTAKELQARAEVEKAQAQKKQQELVKARGKLQEENRELQESIKELQNATKPFPQLVVIGVDVSASTIGVSDQIKEAYRDVLHAIRSNNSGAKVSIVLHGAGNSTYPPFIQDITSTTFQFVEKHSNGLKGAEDYDYCLKNAQDIFDGGIGSKRLVVLIGDGCGDSQTPAVLAACGQFSAINILVHSIIFQSYSPFWNDRAMESISDLTGGRVERQETYLAALNGIFLHERKQYFATSKD